MSVEGLLISKLRVADYIFPEGLGGGHVGIGAISTAAENRHAAIAVRR